MLRKILLCLSAFFLFCTASVAQWQTLGIQYTTHAVDISAALNEHDSLMIFLADSTCRLYKSTNADSGWTEITHLRSYNPSCVLSVSGTDTVYAGRYMGIPPESAGVFRSIDNGDNWDRMAGSGLTNFNIISLAYCSGDPAFMFSGSDTCCNKQRPVFHWSSNGGVQWKPIPDDTPPMEGSTAWSAIFDVMFIPGDTIKGFAAAGEGHVIPRHLNGVYTN